jgi:hypothetical protein
VPVPTTLGAGRVAHRYREEAMQSSVDWGGCGDGMRGGADLARRHGNAGKTIAAAQGLPDHARVIVW